MPCVLWKLTCHNCHIVNTAAMAVLEIKWTMGCIGCCNTVFDLKSSVPSLYGRLWTLNFPYKEDTELWSLIVLQYSANQVFAHCWRFHQHSPQVYAYIRSTDSIIIRCFCGIYTPIVMGRYCNICIVNFMSLIYWLVGGMGSNTVYLWTAYIKQAYTNYYVFFL